ncbi:MAG TPA: 7-carboxy-7-deazaguanine synthase [Allosphingosinicella sp.]|jgi:7-carboxy-7-deazaguanine synthase (Cx14CxxC type)|nr:7-carboxy-7-deazaguanine synthase [Allosphingosinicella sp.]
MAGYAVKEIFKTLQGEGRQAGRAAVFCRFSGCNLWSGREIDRARAICTFCDTDFVGTNGLNGGRYATPEALASVVEQVWSGGSSRRLCVLTGGEPFLQVDAPLVEALQARGFEVAVETNGTIDLPAPVDWLCVSPKAGTALRLVEGDELKLVFPQAGIDPADFESLSFAHFLLQPKDGPDVRDNIAAAIEYCLANPRWRLSVQTHKQLGIP